MSNSKAIIFFIPLTTFASFVYADTTYGDADFASPVSTITSNSKTGNTTINTSAAATPQVTAGSAYGFNVLDGTTLTINNTSDFKINSSSFGIRATNNLDTPSSVLLNGPGEMIINSTQRGIFVGDTSTLTSNSKVSINSGMAGIWAYDAGSMEFNKEVNITAKNYGVIAQKMDPTAADPKITFNDKVTINITGSGSAVVAQANPNANAEHGEIVFNNGLVATTADGNVIESTEKTHITIKGDSELTSNNSDAMVAMASDGQIDITGKSIINGHVAGINNGVVNLDLTPNSVVNGAMTTNSGSGQVNAKLNGSVWNMSESSDITSLALNNSQVNFKNAAFSQLTTNTLSGSGEFGLKPILLLERVIN